MQQETCRCTAYKFPHREGSGRCHAVAHGPYCGNCGKPAIPVQRDFGIGPFEFHGNLGTHRDVQTMSDCCDAPLYSDASLTIEYHE